MPSTWSSTQPCAPTSARPTPARWWRCPRPTRPARSPRPKRSARGSTRWSTQGVLAGYDSPARLLPSPATQRARLAALPDAATLCGAAGRGDRRRAAAGGAPRRLRRRRAGARARPALRSRGARRHAARHGGRCAAAARRREPAVARPAQPAGGAGADDRCGPRPRSDRRRSRRAAWSRSSPSSTRSTPATCARPSGRRRSARRRWCALLALALRNARRLVEVLLPIAAATRRRARPRWPRRRGARHPAPGRPAADGGDRLELRAVLRPPARAPSGSTRTRSPRCCSPT